MIHRRTALIILLGIAAAPLSPLFANGTTGGDWFTIFISCGSQGIVDQPHEVEVTVADAAGKKTTVKVSVPELSDSAAVSGLIATELRLSGIGAGTRETCNEELNKKQAEDVYLPTGYTVVSVTVYKNGSKDNGHLKAYDSSGNLMPN